MKNSRPAKSRVPVLTQLCKWVPPHLVPTLAREYGIDKQQRTFSAWSHVTSLLFAQLTHSVGLNDTCDAMRNHEVQLCTLRGATPPARNTLSHASKTRDSAMMEALFWGTLRHLESSSGGGFGLRYKGLPRRFMRAIHAVDSSTIALVANCMDWAKHRRRKAAAKMHLRLDLGSFLPSFAIIGPASEQDNTRAVELCAGLESGEVALFDKAYTKFDHLNDLTGRGVNWVTRAKDNLAYTVRKKLVPDPEGRVLRDDVILLKTPGSKKRYPEAMRRVEMYVEVDGKEVVMAFLTNNFDWAPSSVGGLYKSRWGIEVFFKQIKQTLKVNDFLGYSENAIRWQLWSALLLYVLMRFAGNQCGWTHSFARLLAVVRGVVWDRYDMYRLLRSYGTAGGGRMRAAPEGAYLPGFAP